MNEIMSTNEKLIISATNFARSLLNIDEDLWVFINEQTHFNGNDHSALYDKENFLIRYNKEWLKNANSENIIKTAFHEVFHVLQHSEILESELGRKSRLFSNVELKQMKHEFKDENYSTESGKYENLLIEQQAESFAYGLYELYNQRIKTEEKLIKKYFDLYLNKS